MPMKPWASDVILDDAIAERLLAARFPELGPISLRHLGAGWDNYAYLVNESIVFRIPHRLQGAELMETECKALTYLCGHELPLKIPQPLYQAAPGDDFPYRIAGYPLIVGQTADSVDWSPVERAQNAGRLGHFLSKLHRLPSNVPFAIGDELRRADLVYRLPNVLSRLKSPPQGFQSLLEDLATTPLTNAPCWVHGDLYSRHLVASAKKEICGIIDWGDTHIGDPALDIAIAWMFLPPTSWGAFSSAYGTIDENTWRRARFRAMTHYVYLSAYAEDRSDAFLAHELAFVLENVLGTD